MKHLLILIPLVILSSLGASGSPYQVGNDEILTSSSTPQDDSHPPISGDWQLVFEDNFDYFDTSKWNADLPNQRKSVGSSDACFFIPENVQAKDGKLELISRKQKLKFKNKHGKAIKKKYSSGQINSYAKFAQTYGYFEARMKLPRSRGLWPAFWLMPNRISPKIWSTFREDDGQGMEIDIMEHLTEWGPDRFHYAAHWDGNKDERQSIGAAYRKASESEYRNFGLYWEKNLLIWFIDGQEIRRWESERIADIPLHILLSTEMGGWATNRIKNLPATTYIDYVKVWSGKAQLNPIADYGTEYTKRQGKWKDKGCYLISRKKDSSLTWQPKITPGRYKIYAKWPETKKKLKAPAKFVIKHSNGKKEIVVNQKLNANYWYPLGKFTLGADHQIELKAQNKAKVLISAIRYEKQR